MAKTIRNAKGLVDALFDNIDKVNEKVINPEEARAIAHSARAIVGIAALELEVHRFQREIGKDADGAAITVIKSLSIEPPR